jgi:hypothetical protein
MVRLTVMAITVAATALTGCEDMFSLTPMEDVGSFEVEARLPETDAALVARAESHGFDVNRDPKPRERAIPRDYLATVNVGRCLLVVEGSGSTASANVKVTLGAAQGSSCNEEMRDLFTSLRRDLQKPSAT